MANKCSGNCVSMKKYKAAIKKCDDIIVENKALKDKIRELERGKLKVKKIESSDPIDSGSSGFDTARSSLGLTSDDFVSPSRYLPRRARGRGGKKKKTKGNSKGKKGKKSVKRMRG